MENKNRREEGIAKRLKSVKQKRKRWSRTVLAEKWNKKGGKKSTAERLKVKTKRVRDRRDNVKEQQEKGYKRKRKKGEKRRV